MENKKLLVVDDDQFLRSLITDKLNPEGFQIFQAGDGEEGLQSALLNRPDLILLDVIMPKMDGFAMMRALRQNEWGKTVPIILLTQMQPDDKTLREIMEHKPTYYLIKGDFTIADVVEKVKGILSSP